MKIIYDEARAIKEKTEVDAFNKRLRRPVKILAIITLGVILFAVVATILSKANLVVSVYSELAITLAVFFAVALLVVWHTQAEKELRYSANVEYYCATHGRTITSHGISHSISDECRYSGPSLDVWVKDQDHKEKCISIRIFNHGVKKGISDDVVDLVEPLKDRWTSYCGNWYEPFDRKVKELESIVVDNDGKNAFEKAFEYWVRENELQDLRGEAIGYQENDVSED